MACLFFFKRMWFIDCSFIKINLVVCSVHDPQTPPIHNIQFLLQPERPNFHITCSLLRHRRGLAGALVYCVIYIHSLIPRLLPHFSVSSRMYIRTATGSHLSERATDAHLKTSYPKHDCSSACCHSRHVISCHWWLCY